MFINILKKEQGQGLVEYALILVLIAIVVIVGVTQLGEQVKGVFDDVNSELGEAGGDVAAGPQGQDFGNFLSLQVNIDAMSQQEAEDSFCETYADNEFSGYNIYNTGDTWLLHGSTFPEEAGIENLQFMGTGSCP